MSFVFGNSFQSGLQENDSENQGPRRLKRDGVLAQKNGPVATKRAALGTITNQVRVQPFRAAKGATDGLCGDENAFARSSKPFGMQEGQTFSIYVDEPTVQELKPVSLDANTSTDSKIELHDAVTALPRQPLSVAVAPSDDIICIDDSVIESPMVLDITHDEHTEKKPLDREAVILNVPEYSDEIYAYLRQAELRHRPKSNYVKKQPDISTSMRCILVDWLVEVAEEYKLHRETLFLCVNYIDRFLSQMSVLRGKLQLVGAASMFLASKYEEIYPPDVSEFAYITDDTYTKKQVLRMEHLVLKVLTFDVAVPTINWFCEHFLNQLESDEKTKEMTMFLAELTLIDCETFLKYLPSEIAASSLYLARYSLGLEPWPKSLEKSSGYMAPHLSACLQELHDTYVNAPNHPQQAVMEKYKTQKHNEVSNFQRYPPPDCLPFLS